MDVKQENWPNRSRQMAALGGMKLIEEAVKKEDVGEIASAFKIGCNLVDKALQKLQSCRTDYLTHSM